MARKKPAKKKKSYSGSEDNKPNLFVAIYETETDDEGNNNDWRETTKDWRPRGIFTTRERAENYSSWCPDSLCCPFGIEDGELLFVIVVRYSTGHTFGCTTGEGTVAAATKVPEVAKKLRNLCAMAENFTVEIPEDIRNIVATPYGGDIHAHWLGYFERLESIHVFQFAVNKSPDGEYFFEEH